MIRVVEMQDSGIDPCGRQKLIGDTVFPCLPEAARDRLNVQGLLPGSAPERSRITKLAPKTGNKADAAPDRRTVERVDLCGSIERLPTSLLA